MECGREIRGVSRGLVSRFGHALSYKLFRQHATRRYSFPSKNNHAVVGLFVVAAFAFLILTSPAALAQNDVGSVVGFVTDPSGAAVANATVTITNEGTGEKRTVTADAQGHYAVPNLPPATYTMTAEAKGFQKFESTHNALANG
jgi:uncharacterized protein YfaS (alpha-2-macroglobulin family)